MAKAVNVDNSGVLPENLFSTIVSFLPSKEAARTSILSKQWRYVWLSTGNIDFDESFFVKLEGSEENREIQRRAFVDFLRKYIFGFKQSVIDKLTLKLSDPEKFADDVTSCMGFAIARKVKTLAIDFSDPRWDEENEEDHATLLDLPSEVYEHEILESLSLFSCGFRVIESEKIFGNLKHLSLGWIELNLCCFKKVLTYCKMLESLSLKKCWNLGHLEIKGEDLRIRRLVVDKCSFLEEISLLIEAPKLGFLKYSGKVGVFDLQLSSSLDEVDFDFTLQKEHDEALSNILCMMLDDIYPIRVLTVCSFMLQVVPNGDEPFGLPSPLNARHLTMKILMHPNEFHGIKFFLRSCPMLETLSIQLGHGRVLPDYESPLELDPIKFWTENLVLYKCLIKTLKVVEVKGFTGGIHEVCFLFYLISIARSLKELKIIIAENNSREFRESLLEKAQSLNNLNSASKDLVISIS